MPDDRESASGQALDARQTAMQLENAAAAVAVKVVMVGFSGTLVDRGGAGKIDGRKPTGVQQSLDIPVHGGDPESLDFGLRGG